MAGTIATPTPEQEQRVKWDLLLADLELRQEQLHQLKTYEGWKLAFSGMIAGAAIVAAITAAWRLVVGA